MHMRSHLHIVVLRFSLNKSMKLILTAYFTLKNGSKISALTIFPFSGHFSTFQHFNAIFEPHRPIQNCSRFTQISITIGTLCFCKKKGQNISFNTIFLGKIAVFCTKTRFFFVWLKLGQNEHQNLVLQPFQVPCAKIWDGSIFFFS